MNLPLDLIQSFAILALAWWAWRLHATLRARQGAPACTHCWHWMLAAMSGRITYRQCCWCGVVHATYQDAPRILHDARHGPYVEEHSSRDTASWAS